MLDEPFISHLFANDSRRFWRKVSNLRGKSKKSSHIIEGYSNDSDISECFAQSYRHVFNQQGTKQAVAQSPMRLQNSPGDCLSS